MLLTSDMTVTLPSSSKLWRAENAWQWQMVRHTYTPVDVTLQDALAKLFCRPPQAPFSSASSLANYVLIHALIQHIFFLKQTSFIAAAGYVVNRSIKMEDLEEVGQAIRAWQQGFEQHHQMQAAEANSQGFAVGSGSGASGGTGTNDALPGGPVAFNSTALLRLAYIRLYTELGPAQTLETRDPAVIAQSLAESPPVTRSFRLNRAILQAIHALSMLVKLGVNYVARAKSLEWSIQHSRKCLSKHLRTSSANPATLLFSMQS